MFGLQKRKRKTKISFEFSLSKNFSLQEKLLFTLPSVLFAFLQGIVFVLKNPGQLC